jgi:hypothetical protein
VVEVMDQCDLAPASSSESERHRGQEAAYGDVAIRIGDRGQELTDATAGKGIEPLGIDVSEEDVEYGGKGALDVPRVSLATVLSAPRLVKANAG